MGYYRHYKGGYYQVTGSSKHSETGETMVEYRHVSADVDHGEKWVRPAAMWNDQVLVENPTTSVVPRFAPVTEADYESFQFIALCCNDCGSDLDRLWFENPQHAIDYSTTHECSFCGAQDWGHEAIEHRMLKPAAARFKATFVK